MNLDILRKKLKIRNQRMTIERELVLGAFLDSDAESLNIIEIREKIYDKRKRISKTTIQRILDIFYEIGIIKKIEYSDKMIRYVIIREEEEDKDYYIICKKCGKAFSYTVENNKKILETAEKQTGFIIDDFELEFIGLCPECSGEE